ncbi:hypothetical protein [Paenibacillus sp. 1P07SE]|uniref:hypothetical protein n=1 Tax=Paenibacillus sp. 1P07SE TaxID=3132209 RepID=UPI0039A4B3AA
MRWGSILAGGLLGIAAAAVIARRRPGALHLVGEGVSTLWRGLSHRTLDRMFNREAERDAAAPAVHDAQAGAEGMAVLEQLVANDPVARSEANKILTENHLSSH